MAMFAIEIADADIMRVLNSLASNYHRPEMVKNPNYIGPMKPNPDWSGAMIPNPNWEGAMIPNPNYTGPMVDNPYFDPDLEDSADNPSTIPTSEPEFISNPEPEFIVNPEPEFIESDEPEYIQNPETLPVFANRIVRQFLSENVKAYEIRMAKEAAEQALSALSGPSIIDPQLEN